LSANAAAHYILFVRWNERDRAETLCPPFVPDWNVMIDDVYNAKILGFAGNIGRIGRLAEPDASATAHSKLCGSTAWMAIRSPTSRMS
jgi:hypothetical protein